MKKLYANHSKLGSNCQISRNNTKERRFVIRPSAVLMVSAALLIFVTGFVQPATAQSPKYGGVLRVITGGSPPVIGYPPRIMAAPTKVNILPCLQPLFRRDENGRTLPFLAQSYEVGQDYRSITISLRKGVKFHDGTDFNADAVKFNLDEAKAAGLGRIAIVTSIDIIDEYTVRLNLSQWNNALLPYLAGQHTLIISPTAFKKYGKKKIMAYPVGTGPFKFVSFQRNVSLKYEKFDGYWGKGKPYLDGIEFLLILDPMTQLAAFKAGKAQILLSSRARDAHSLEKMGYNAAPCGAPFECMGGDSANPDSPFADKRVREAIEYAIDRKTIAQSIGYGSWEALNQLCESFRPVYIPDMKGRPYNPEKARHLLAEAGYPKGFETTIIINKMLNRDAWVAIQRDLQKVGINAKLDIADLGRWVGYRRKGWKNSLMSLMMTLDNYITPAMQNYLASFSRDYVSLKRPAGLDDLVRQGTKATDGETHKALDQKLIRMMSDEAMLIPLWSKCHFFIMDKSVHGTVADKKLDWWWNPADIWLSK